LTLEALRRRGISVRRVVVSGYGGKTRVEKTNLVLLKKLADVPVTALPRLSSPGVERRAAEILRGAFAEDFGR
jgi:dethiobiotin synthetase